MVIDLHPAVSSDWIGRTVGGSIRPDVVSHLSIDTEYLLLCLLPLEECKVRRTRLLDAGAPASPEKHTSELPAHHDLECRLPHEKKTATSPTRMPSSS